MKIFVLTASNSDGTDIFHISAYKKFEDAQAEMQRQFWKEWETIKEEDGMKDDEMEGNCGYSYSWLIYNYCEGEMYTWEINQTEVKE